MSKKPETSRVSLKHTNESGDVVWERSYESENPTSDEAYFFHDGDRATVQWPGGMTLLYIRPGERVEILFEGDDE